MVEAGAGGHIPSPLPVNVRGVGVWRGNGVTARDVVFL